MKKIISSVLLLLLLFIVTCSDEDTAIPAELRITVSGECKATISIYETNGKQLEKATYDCQQTNTLVFHINRTGILIVYAESGKKQDKKVINIARNKTTEVTMSL
jgi:hypothetical protein